MKGREVWLRNSMREERRRDEMRREERGGEEGDALMDG